MKILRNLEEKKSDIRGNSRLAQYNHDAEFEVDLKYIQALSG